MELDVLRVSIVGTRGQIPSRLWISSKWTGEVILCRIRVSFTLL